MRFLNDEAVFIALVLFAASLWAVIHQPSVLSSLLLVMSGWLVFWKIVRMAWFRP